MITFEGLLLGMCSHVHVEMTFLGKRFSTFWLCTLERSLFGVGQLVTAKISTPQKFLLALMAYKLLGSITLVREQVSSQTSLD